MELKPRWPSTEPCGLKWHYYANKITHSCSDHRSICPTSRPAEYMVVASFWCKRWSHYTSTVDLWREPELSAWQEQRPGVWPLSAQPWVHGWKQALYQRADIQPTEDTLCCQSQEFSLFLRLKLEMWAFVVLLFDPISCSEECNKMRNVVFDLQLSMHHIGSENEFALRMYSSYHILLLNCIPEIHIIHLKPFHTSTQISTKE